MADREGSMDKTGLRYWLDKKGASQPAMEDRREMVRSRSVGYILGEKEKVSLAGMKGLGKGMVYEGLGEMGASRLEPWIKYETVL